MVTATKRRTKAAAKPVEVEPEEVEELEEEVEELEEDEIEEGPSGRSNAAKKRAKATVSFGMIHLAEYLSEEVGKAVTTRELRQLARKLARDNSGRVEREIVAGNRARYDWPDINHPEVQAIIAAYHGGELEDDKKAKLDALKASKAAKTAAKKAEAEAEVDEDEEEAPAPKPRRTATKRAPAKRTVTKKAAPVVEEDDEDLELGDDDE